MIVYVITLDYYISYCEYNGGTSTAHIPTPPTRFASKSPLLIEFIATYWYNRSSSRRCREFWIWNINYNMKY